MSRRSFQFSSVRTEGGLLPQDVLSRIQAGDKNLPGLTPETYHLGPHERFGEAVNRAWSRVIGAWRAFQESLAKEPDAGKATGLTRDRWLLPLFQELGYGRLPKGQAIEVDGKSYAVSHMWHLSPIHLLGVGVDLDRRQAGVSGAAKASPHGLVQEFLNRSEHHLWGFVSNGLELRVLRDHHSLTRQAYVEFDLQSIMEGEQYSEFLLLWMVCHQSRVEAERPDECWLEQWFNTSRKEGVSALEKMFAGAKAAIESFGTGFLAHRTNIELHDALEKGEIDKQDYYRQVLRLVYRLIFLFVAEERDALLDPQADDAAKARYIRFYATRRLRQLSDKRRGGPHSDLWQGLRLVMSKLDNGCRELALPALGSRLWGPTACPALMDAECSNEHVLDAVRHISNIEEGRTRFPVNWRNVGADELGSIYEGLLELHPRINREAATFVLDTAAGHERKTTGSYYTPTALVDCLLDSALEPLLDEACKKPAPEATILDLKVCDPACGSGHFLVAAARRIAKRLAAVRAGEDEPSPREVQHALRDVVGRCVYGVDVNAMAVELCKVSLWIEALEPGRPLSFLDNHIRRGNALIGASPSVMEQGVPDVAWTALKDEDKAIASRLRKRNQSWQQRELPNTSGVSPEAQVVSAFVQVDSGDDSTRDALAWKEKAWRALEDDPAVRHVRVLADLWCAAFVWPKEAGEPEQAAPVRGLWEDARRAPENVPATTLRLTEALARRYGFFHWHLAFPVVFARGGFDLILGNPPWDTLSPDQREFFAQWRPDMRSLSPDEQERVVSQLLADETIAKAWSQRCRDLYAIVHFLKNSRRFTLYAPGNLGKGDFNIYRMFVELALKTIRPGGFAAQVAPGGLYGGANASAIRQFLFDQCELKQLLGLINTRRGWFEKVDIDRFCAYAARAGGRTESFLARFGLTGPTDLALAPVLVDAKVIREQAPDTYAIPDVRSASDVSIAEKMYARHLTFGDASAGPPIRHYQREIDMGNDNGLFTTEPSGLPVYEGRMIDHFDHRAKTYVSGHGNSSVWEVRPFGDPNKAIVPQWRVSREAVPSRLSNRVDRYRMGFGDVANPRNERSFVAALIPPSTICGDKVPTLDFGPNNDWMYLPWLAVANSFVMDWLARSKLSSAKMSFTIVDGLPFPRPTLTDGWVQRVARLVLRLTCTAPEMTAFWNAMVNHGLCDAVPDRTVPPSALVDEESRALARAEIDAVVAREVFGLTTQELADVLETFPVVKKRDVKAHGEYRTKRMILEAFDALAARGESLDALALPAIIPALEPAQEAAVCVWALLHASTGVIPHTELARAFVLRSQPSLLERLAPPELQAVAGPWASRVSNRSVKAGALAEAVATLASRDGIKLTTDASGHSLVAASAHTPPEAQIDEWFRFEARLALRVLAAVPAARVQEVDSVIPDADRAVLRAAGVA